MIIRRENDEDANQVQRVVAGAFKTQGEARLVRDLQSGGCDKLSIVAQKSQSTPIIGHILFTPVTVEPPGDLKLMGLAPLSVDKHYQGEGIGSSLVTEGLAQCRKSLVDIVFVLGSPDYYQRFGFVPASEFDLYSKYDIDQRYFMLIELNPGALSSCHGLVNYRQEFDLL